MLSLSLSPSDASLVAAVLADRADALAQLARARRARGEHADATSAEALAFRCNVLASHCDLAAEVSHG